MRAGHQEALKIVLIPESPTYIASLYQNIENYENNFLQSDYAANESIKVYINKLKHLYNVLSADWYMRNNKLAPQSEKEDKKAEYLANITINLIGQTNIGNNSQNNNFSFYAKNYLNKCDTQSLPKKIFKAAAAVAISLVVAAAVIGLAVLALTTPLGLFAALAAPAAFIYGTAGASLALGATAGILSGIKFFQPGPRTAAALDVGKAAKKIDLKQGLL